MEKLQGKLKELAEKVNPVFLEFDSNNILPIWPSYTAVSKFKSVRRAIKRGNLDLFTGIPFPTRPFNNRKPSGRKFNEMKKTIYGQLKQRGSSAL